jgi:HAD superfamily hydrolase (TIGR01509 family)
VDQRTLKGALTVAHGVLFDFDGPLARLFSTPPGEPEYLAHPIARQLKMCLQEEGVWASPIDELAASLDPHEIYRTACAALRRKDPSGSYDALIATLRRILDDGEVDAAATAAPTPDAAEFVAALDEAGKKLAVASNNAGAAITAFLQREDVRLMGCFVPKAIVGRPDHAEWMKPDPHALLVASRRLGVSPSQCLMIGDSPADAAAARAAGVAFCGYAPNKRTRARLQGAKVPAEWMVTGMTQLQGLLRPSAARN